MDVLRYVAIVSGTAVLAYGLHTPMLNAVCNLWKLQALQQVGCGVIEGRVVDGFRVQVLAQARTKGITAGCSKVAMSKVHLLWVKLQARQQAAFGDGGGCVPLLLS